MSLRITVPRAQAQFPELIERVVSTKENVLITVRGKAVAAIIPIEAVRLLEKLIWAARKDLRVDLHPVSRSSVKASR